MINETKLNDFYNYCLQYNYLTLFNKQYEQIPYSLLHNLKREMADLNINLISRNFYYNIQFCRQPIQVQCSICHRDFESSMKQIYNHFSTDIQCHDTYCMDHSKYKQFQTSEDYATLKNALTTKCQYSEKSPKTFPISYFYIHDYKVYKLSKGLIHFIQTYLENRALVQRHAPKNTSTEFSAKEFTVGPDDIPVRFNVIGDLDYDSLGEYEGIEHRMVTVQAAFPINMFKELTDTMSLFCHDPEFQKKYATYKQDILVIPDTHSNYMSRKNIYKYNVHYVEYLYHLYCTDMIKKEHCKIKQAIRDIPLCCDDMNYLVYSYLYTDDYFSRDEPVSISFLQ